MQSKEYHSMDIRKFFWKLQKPIAAESNKKTSSHESKKYSSIPSKNFQYKPFFNDLDLSDLIPFQSIQSESQHFQKKNKKISQISKPKDQSHQQKQREKQAKRRLRQMYQQLDKLLRQKKKKEKKQLKEQQKMKQIQTLLKQEEFPDVYHMVYDEELTAFSKEKTTKKPIKYIRFLKNEQPVPKMSKQDFIQFGKKRIIAKVMSEKGYSMKEIVEQVKILNSPTIREITRTEMKNYTFNIVAATIRKLQSFLRVFAKKLPSGSNPNAFPLKKFLKKQSVKNKSHFIMNFAHRFEIAHKMAFMKFIFLEFRLKDVEISPQEAVDLVVYLGRNIEDPNYGYERLVDVEEKKEGVKGGEEELSGDEENQGMDERIKILEEAIRREEERQENFQQPEAKMSIFDEPSRNNWRTSFQQYVYPKQISIKRQKYGDPEKSNNKDIEYRKFYKNLTHLQNNESLKENPLTQPDKNPTYNNTFSNQAQQIDRELQSLNEEDNYQNESCKVNYFPEMDENERSFIDELRCFEENDEGYFETHENNITEQHQHQSNCEEDNWQDENETKQYERFYANDRYREPLINSHRYIQPFAHSQQNNSKLPSKYINKQSSTSPSKRYITDYELNRFNNIEQTQQIYQEKHQRYVEDRKKNVVRKENRQSKLLEILKFDEQTQQLDKPQIQEDKNKSIQGSRKLKESLVKQIQVIELETSHDQDPKLQQKGIIPKQNALKSIPLQKMPKPLQKMPKDYPQTNNPLVQPITDLKIQMTLTQQQQQKIRYYKLLDEQIMEILLNMKNGKPYHEEDQQQQKNENDEQADISINRITYYMNKKYRTNPQSIIEQNAQSPKQFTPQLILSRVSFIFTAVSEFTYLTFATYLKSLQKNSTTIQKKKPKYDIKQILLARIKDNILILFVKQQETQKIKERKMQQKNKNFINLQENYSTGQEDSGQTEDQKIDEDKIKQTVSKMNERMKSILFEQGMKKIITQELSNFYKKHFIKFTQSTSSKKKSKPQGLKNYRVAISPLHKSFLTTYYKFYQEEKYTIQEKKQKQLMKEDYLSRYIEEMMPMLTDLIDEVIGAKKEIKKGKHGNKKSTEIEGNREKQMTEHFDHETNQVDDSEKVPKKRGRKKKEKNLMKKNNIQQELKIMEPILPNNSLRQSEFCLLPNIKSENQPQPFQQLFILLEDQQQNNFIKQTSESPLEQQKIVDEKIRQKAEKASNLKKKPQKSKIYDKNNEVINYSRCMVPIELQMSEVEPNYEIYDEEEDSQPNQVYNRRLDSVKPEIQKDSPERYVWSGNQDSPVNALIQLENIAIKADHHRQQIDENPHKKMNANLVNQIKSRLQNKEFEDKHEQIDLSKYMIPFYQQNSPYLQKNISGQQQNSEDSQQPPYEDQIFSGKQKSKKDEPPIKKTKNIQKADKSERKHEKPDSKLKLVKVDPVPKQHQKTEQNKKKPVQKKSEQTKNTRAKIKVSKPSYEQTPQLTLLQSSESQTPPIPKKSKCQISSIDTISSSQTPQADLGEKLRNIEQEKMTREQEKRMLEWYKKNNRKEVDEMMNFYMEIQRITTKQEQKAINLIEDHEINENQVKKTNSPQKLQSFNDCEPLLDEDEYLIYHSNLEQPMSSQSSQYMSHNLQATQEYYELDSNEEKQVCYQLDLPSKNDQIESKPIKKRLKAKNQTTTSKKSEPKPKPRTKTNVHRK